MALHLEHKVSGGRRFKRETKKSRKGLPLVSIITPVLNGGDRVEKVIEEVQCQTYANKEHIIIDGGSDDGTVDVLERRDGEIDYWVSEEDAGIYDAMNKGIDVAGGEWIYFLGADDAFYQPYTVESIMNNGAISD